VNSFTSLFGAVKSRLSKFGYWKAGGLALVVLGALFIFTRDEKTAVTTLSVVRGDFVQEVSASGKVVAAQSVDLGFPQGGRIARVYVKAGSRVGAGATLAEIENGELRSLVSQREASVAAEESQLRKIRAGERAEEIAVAEADVDAKETSLEQARRALRDEIEDAYRSAEDTVRNTVDAFISNPRTNPQLNAGSLPQQLEIDAEAQRMMLEALLRDWNAEIAALPAEGSLSSAVSSTQAKLAKVATFLATINAALNQALPTGSVTQTMITGYIADVGGARTTINASISALTSAQTAERNAATALTSSERALALKKAGATPEDIEEQEAQIKVAEANLEDARAQLRKTIVSAPFSGTITAVDAKVGTIASANTNAVSMIGTGTFQIESYIPEINISLIEVGHSATITLDAYGEEVPFEATVVSIDPAETVRDGVSTYRAMLQFTGADARIRSGMTANIVIKTKEKKDVLAVPRGTVKERDGKKYVTVQVDEETTAEREVTTGDYSSGGTVEILSGLEVGEKVVLSSK
jgi:HlyD family secretion protein